jgi:hypothetical protein
LFQAIIPSIKQQPNKVSQGRKKKNGHCASQFCARQTHISQQPGVVPSQYEHSGLLIYTLQLIPTITFALRVKSTEKNISGVLKNMQFSHTFSMTTHQNPILSYILH